MANREVELLAVGAGPSNLALAVALEELAPGLARNSLVIERDKDVPGRRECCCPRRCPGVVPEGPRDAAQPAQQFSFLNYLHAIGRLDEFVNLGSFVPYRIELAGYLKWTAESLSQVDVQLGTECTDISPCGPMGR